MTSPRRKSTPPASPVALHKRLTALSAEAAEILCALHVQRRRWEFGRDDDAFWFEATVAPRRHCAQRVGVVIDGHPGELALHHSSSAEPIGELDWSDYADTARLTAWTLTHRRAMTRLAQVFRGIVLPQALVDAAAADPTGLVTLGFRIGAGEDTSEEGVLRVAPAIARRLLARSDIAQPARPLAALATLPVQVRVGLPGPALDVTELRSLVRGDVIVLGTRASALARLDLRVAGSGTAAAWRASWHDGRVRIDAAIDPSIDSLQGPTMTDNEDTPPVTADGASAPAADPLAQLPVRVDFTLGELELPLARLSQLEPGYVFNLVDNLDTARIGIRANGRRIGSGRIVAVGDTLGVQLEGWESDGLQ